MPIRSLVAVSAVLLSCAAPPASSPAPVAHLEQNVATRTTPPATPVEPPASKAPEAPARDALLDFVRAHLPAGGHAARDASGALVVTHDVAKKETAVSIARAYLEVSDVYLASALAKDIQKKNHVIAPGKTIVIPDVVTAPVPSPADDRMAWPDDKALRGVYLGGRDALGSWESTMDHLAARGMNAVILDGKAYMGDVTYPSKVDVAVRTKAIKGAPIADLARTIHFAHKHGIRVSVRVSCFHDPLAARAAPELSVKGYWGGPYPIGWLDPGDAKTQKYIFDLVHEVIAQGADEVNLDYVRYPVQHGLGNADFHLKDTGRTRIGVITDFVHHVHEITQAAHVPLSVDIFGVTAIGTRQDVERLGQDIAKLGPEVEVLMPMVYPSHYGTGFYGWAIPGNHPEIVAIGTKAAMGKLKAAGATKTLVRPWLQAFFWRSPEYGPKYLAQETVEAGNGGGTGWIMWNPGGYYGDAWRALPAKK